MFRSMVVIVVFVISFLPAAAQARSALFGDGEPDPRDESTVYKTFPYRTAPLPPPVTGHTHPAEAFADFIDDRVPSALRQTNPTTGEMATLVLLFNFLDDQSEPNTRQEVEDMVFSETTSGSVNARLVENSYGKAWLAGEVLDWITLPINAADCSGWLRPYSSTIQNAADYVDDQVDFSLYRRLFILNPFGDCTVGGVGSFGDIRINTDEGQFEVSVAHYVLGPGVDPPRGLFHELGHNFELTHPDDLECGQMVVADSMDGCEPIDRGDIYDCMRGGGQAHHNATSKEGLGWLEPQNIAVLGVGTHEILLRPFELPTDQWQAIRVPAGDYKLLGVGRSGYYMVEYRQAIGLDAAYPQLEDPAVGVLVHLTERYYYYGSQLLDMSPHATTAGYSQVEDSADAFLQLGQTFTDTRHDVSITFTGVTGEGALITVDIQRICPDGTCDPGEDSCNCPVDCGPPAVDDCTRNGVPDECEVDCNGNGVADSCDIANGTSEDCGDDPGNGIPDECDPQVDCNGNGAIDSCDLAGGSSLDLNADGVPDDCQPHEIVYVDDSNCPGPGTGTSQDPFCNIQDAIDSLDPYAGYAGVFEIIVADGTYSGARNKNLDFAGRRITLRSAGGPQNCILDMEGDGRGFLFQSGETAGARVEGLTITNGSPGTYFDGVGGGIYCTNASSPTIVDCTISGNVVEALGGGIAIDGRSNPIIRNCRITNNQVTNSWGTMYGGGICCSAASVTIDRCLIAGNSAAGMHQLGYGGGVALWGAVDVTVRNSMIVHNHGSAYGGGVFSGVMSGATISNCTLTRNTAGELGGGIWVRDGQATITNTILWDNSAVDAGDQLATAGYSYPATVAVGYSDVQGGRAGVAVRLDATLDWRGGNINADPGLVDPDGPDGDPATWDDNDLHLRTDSLCINAGDPFFPAGLGETDIDGEPRVMDGRVDMGADEISLDCNGNGIPDVDDIASGSSPDCNDNGRPDECEHDLDGDGVIDACDPCPSDNPDDTDGDGICDTDDACPGWPDDVDADGDTVPDFCDPCPQDNPDDTDGDGVCDSDDVCPGYDDALDADGDGVPDACDICPDGNDFIDCQPNGVPDACDISSGTSLDDDGNGIPDECGCQPPELASLEPDVPDAGAGTRVRYLSFSGGTGRRAEAARVRFDLAGDTLTMWVGPPHEVSESSGDSGPTLAPTFWAAPLQCDPYLTDWAEYEAIHAYHPSVVPGASYEIALAWEGCEFDEAGFTPTPLVITTSAWGDVVSNCSTPSCGPPDGDADFDDIAAVVDKFMNRPVAPQKSRVDLAPDTPDQIVDFLDIPRAVDAFRGLPYPFDGSSGCP